jgi:hypothetical protein
MSQAIKRCGAEHLVGRERITPFRKIKIGQDGRCTFAPFGDQIVEVFIFERAHPSLAKRVGAGFPINRQRFHPHSTIPRWFQSWLSSE